MKFKFSILISIAIIFVACKGEPKLSDSELIEKNVRSFFFMGDSVEVDVTITDTIHDTDLAEMLANVEENKRLIQMDIDTLGLMIDERAYKVLDLESKVINVLSEGFALEICNAKLKLAEYRLKLKELEFQKAIFDQTNRILLHLKRSIWANIAGFEANVHYQLGDEINDLEILMDANYVVVD